MRKLRRLLKRLNLPFFGRMPQVASTGLTLLATQAKKNLLAVKACQPLVGHLLPYIPHDQAQDYEINVHAVNGWLDTLSAPQTESANAESASTP